MEKFVAIDNVCAWPNLTRMPNGDIVATIFNQPCHGKWAGDVECWISVDQGRTWGLWGVPAAHERGTNRMNVAAGLAHNGDFLVIASGWSNKPERAEVDTQRRHGPCDILPPWVCRSSDGGKTWRQSESVGFRALTQPIPFGKVARDPDGALAVSFYDHKRPDRAGRPIINNSYFARSRDDGRTWSEAVVIGAEDYNETDLLCLRHGRWLAAARSRSEGRIDLFASDDDGKTWRPRGPVTGAAQHPAHLVQLSGGAIVLAYGIRYRGFYGVGARASLDDGRTWMTPMVLTDLGGAVDGGYPSSVELKDGNILTAYYCSADAGHSRYHMGVVIWDLREQMASNTRR